MKKVGCGFTVYSLCRKLYVGSDQVGHTSSAISCYIFSVLFTGVNQLQHNPARDLIYTTHFIPMEYYPNAEKYILPKTGSLTCKAPIWSFTVPTNEAQ